MTGQPVSAISTLIARGFNGGKWLGAGIISSTAATDSRHLTAVGIISNAGASGTLYSAFDGKPVGATDVLVRYTYYGDANLDGEVDGSDYSRIDSGVLNQSTASWYNGDFNYDGSIDGTDYTLIDNAFNAQGPVIEALMQASVAGVFNGDARRHTTAASPFSQATLGMTALPNSDQQGLSLIDVVLQEMSGVGWSTIGSACTHAP